MMLIGFAAFAVDVGALYQEKRELQNGADAASIAGAQDCATAVPCPSGALDSTVDQYANANANDGASAADVISVTGGVAEGSLTVETTTIDGNNGQPFLTHWFAWAFGEDSSTSEVVAQATATWTRIGGAETVPLTMSQCEFNRFTTDGTVYESEFLPGNQKIVEFHDGNAVEPCHSSSSGADIPGGFGWLTTDGSSCEAQVTADQWASEDPGSSASTGCDPTVIRALLGSTILIPIFDNVTGLGANGQYHIYGFAAFQLTSYRLGGSPDWNGALPSYAACGSGDVRCVGGHFTQFVDTDGYADPSSPYLGVVTVQLTG